MKDLYQKCYMAKVSKYKGIVLDMLTDKFVSTNQVIKNIKKKTGKSIHWYLIDRVLHDLLKEKKVEKQELKFGKQRIFMWRKR